MKDYLFKLFRFFFFLSNSIFYKKKKNSIRLRNSIFKLISIFFTITRDANTILKIHYVCTLIMWVFFLFKNIEYLYEMYKNIDESKSNCAITILIYNYSIFRPLFSSEIYNFLFIRLPSVL